MTEEKTLRAVQDVSDVERFKAELTVLGFHLSLIAKPFTLVLEVVSPVGLGVAIGDLVGLLLTRNTPHTNHASDLTEHARQTIQSALEKKNADGGLILDRESHFDPTRKKRLISLTLHAYRLDPIGQAPA